MVNSKLFLQFAATNFGKKWYILVKISKKNFVIQSNFIDFTNFTTIKTEKKFSFYDHKVTDFMSFKMGKSV